MKMEFPLKRLVMRAAALVTVTLATASCSWLQSLEGRTRRWTGRRTNSAARARIALDDSNWTQAKDYYQKLEARYPFGQVRPAGSDRG